MEGKISRREFTKRLATGAALLGLQSSCASLSPSLPAGQLLRNDLTDLSGTLLFDDAARQAAADDYGHIVHRLPTAVLKPGSIEDIVKLVQFANRRGLKVAMRGNGHAMFGQAQVDAGVVIDSSSLNSVRIIKYGGRPAIEAGPGALWNQVLDAAYADKLTPPVNVDTKVLSVGGTISTGGFGGITWREGFQVDHVLELQVVTGHGQLVTCSDERNSDLFNAVLAGMGQCGIIVKMVMALVSAPTHVLFFVLSYTDLQAAIADLTFLVNDGRFNHLDGRTSAPPGDRFTYNLTAGSFYDAPNTPNESQLLARLSFTSKTARVMTYADYYRSTPSSFRPLPHPYLHLCLPASRSVEYANRVLATYDIAERRPRTLKSWNAAKDPRRDLSMWEAGLATAAAPTYFPPFSAGERTLVDGGVVANNPSALAFAEARRRWPEEEILLVSLGTGRVRKPYLASEVKKWGPLEWVGPLIDFLFAGASDSTDYVLEHCLPKDRYYRFQCDVPTECAAMDNASEKNIEKLRAVASTFVDDARNEISHAVAALLASYP